MIPPLQLDGGDSLIHFLHANGYPPETYHSFLAHFTPRYGVLAPYLRPMWPGSNPQGVRNWIIFRDDLLRMLHEPERLHVDPQRLDKRNGLIGMGHSIGATVTLMAALKAPAWFRCVVLIEPVLFPPWMGAVFRGLRRLGLLEAVHPLIRRTLNRKRVFDTAEDMYNNYRRKSVFHKLSDEVLGDYVRGLSRSRSDGKIELAYPPEWEARIYETGGTADPIVWRSLPDLDVPVLLIRGEETDTLRMGAVRRMTRLLPNVDVINMPRVGHLVPLEAPRDVASHVRAFLEEI